MREVEITEVFQSLCCLSDAQELLPPPREGGSTPIVVNDKINHAKAHLARLLEWAQESDSPGFIRAIRSVHCTINDDQGPHLTRKKGENGKESQGE